MFVRGAPIVGYSGRPFASAYTAIPFDCQPGGATAIPRYMM